MQLMTVITGNFKGHFPPPARHRNSFIKQRRYCESERDLAPSTKQILESKPPPYNYVNSKLMFCNLPISPPNRCCSKAPIGNIGQTTGEGKKSKCLVPCKASSLIYKWSFPGPEIPVCLQRRPHTAERSWEGATYLNCSQGVEFPGL